MKNISHYQYYTKEKWANINPFNKKAVEDYITECKSRKLSVNTISQYKSDLRILLCFVYEQCNNSRFTVINKKDIRGMIIWLSEDLNLSNARVNRILSCVRSFFAYLEDDEEYKCKQNISQKLKNLPQESVREIIFLENDVIIKLYNYFMDNELYRDATLLALAYESGARKNEMVQVKKQCIINKEYNTNIVVGKRNKKFSLIYFDLTQKAGEKYLKQREDDIDFLFITNNNKPATSSSIYNWIVAWREIVYNLTGEYYKFNVHSFRHSCLQNLMNGTHEVCSYRGINKVGFEELRKIAHHESIVITSSYLKKENDIEYLKNFFKEAQKDQDNETTFDQSQNGFNKNFLDIHNQDFIKYVSKQIADEVVQEVKGQLRTQLKNEITDDIIKELKGLKGES